MKLNKNILKIATLAGVLIFMTVGFAFWQDYLREHFVGGFDQYGLPSQFFRTGWPLALDAWPIRVTPSVLLIILVQTIDRIIRHFADSKKEKIASENAQKMAEIGEAKGKNQMEFNRSLEIESLKQQVEILKKKYF